MKKRWLEDQAIAIVEKMTVEELKQAAVVGIMATIYITGSFAKKVSQIMLEEGGKGNG